MRVFPQVGLLLGQRVDERSEAQPLVRQGQCCCCSGLTIRVTSVRVKDRPGASLRALPCLRRQVRSGHPGEHDALGQLPLGSRAGRRRPFDRRGAAAAHGGALGGVDLAEPRLARARAVGPGAAGEVPLRELRDALRAGAEAGPVSRRRAAQRDTRPSVSTSCFGA